MSMPERPVDPPRSSPAGPLELIERNLRGQLEAYDRLLDCMQRKREAMRSASIDLIRQCCEDERSLIAGIRELELRRQALLKSIPSRRTRAGVSSLIDLTASGADCDASHRLQALAKRLRSRLEIVRRESAIIRAAADSLGRHVAGILQSVTGSLASARVYSRRGRMNLGCATQLAVDLRS